MNKLDEFFLNIKNKKIKLLEIGLTNESIKMWNKYFEQINIYGLDYDVRATNHINYENVELFIGNQAKRGDLKSVIDQIENYLDVILDSGNNIDGHKLTAFSVLFQALKPGGYYIIKNTHYNPHTTEVFKNFLKNKSLYTYWFTDTEKSYIIKNIKCCYIYSKLIFIEKISRKQLI